MASLTRSAPYLVDVAANLTDCVFRGVGWSGQRLHNDDFDSVLDRAEASGVGNIIITGTNLHQCAKAVALCRRYPHRHLRCTVGVHPAHSCEFFQSLNVEEVDAFAATDAAMMTPRIVAPPTDAEEAERFCRERLAYLVELIHRNRDVVVAVGEVGLDGAELSCCPDDVQERFFRLQLEAYAPLGLPFLLHSRDCGLRVLRVLEEMQTPIKGVLHSFNGSLDEQRGLLQLGLYLSINGSAFRDEEVARQICQIPPTRLMLESDAPWCDVRRQDYGHAFIHTHFATHKAKKFVAGACVERRNEPCHVVQVMEAYLGTVEDQRRKGVASELLPPPMTREELVALLYANCTSLFHLLSNAGEAR